MIFLELETKPNFNKALLQNAARITLGICVAPEVDLTLVLTGDEEIRALNRGFLGHDFPTDVLSFPADELDPETGRRYLGDVVISLPRAAEQAAARFHAVETEVQLLVIHGILHLLGHDHVESDEKAQMWKMQAMVMEKLGIKIFQLEE
jgi:probable rRNA maturation factor